jgi:hypothetical protein
MIRRQSPFSFGVAELAFAEGVSSTPIRSAASRWRSPRSSRRLHRWSPNDFLMLLMTWDMLDSGTFCLGAGHGKNATQGFWSGVSISMTLHGSKTGEGL